MIVLIIIGVLLGISLPAYQGYVLQSHRADGQSALLDIAARQERFVAQNNTYTAEVSAVTGLGMGRITSREDYYNMTVAACGTGTLATCYLITATAAGTQANDTACLIITYDSAGVKSGTTADCW